jgi:hypothetical protein
LDLLNAILVIVFRLAGAAVVVFGVFVIACNWAILIAWLRTRRQSSMVPLIGPAAVWVGFIMLAASGLRPLQPVSAPLLVALLPAIIDVGTYSALAGLLVLCRVLRPRQ